MLQCRGLVHKGIWGAQVGTLLCKALGCDCTDSWDLSPCLRAMLLAPVQMRVEREDAHQERFGEVANRIHIAVPAARDGKERPPVIPQVRERAAKSNPRISISSLTPG